MWHWRTLPQGLMLIWIVLATFGPELADTPNAIHLDHILTPPNADSLLGYDDLGRSLTDRMLQGARVSLAVSLSVMLITLIIGTSIGMLSAWYGGWIDHVLVRIMDIFLAFPGILLAIAMAGLLGPGLMNLVIALAVVGWVGFARLTRAQVLSLKHREHIQAAQLLGSSTITILLRHLLPLIAAPLIVEATFAVAGLIIAEAGLSFLGLGVQPPDASWGGMIRDGTRYMLVAPHMVIVPGLCLMLVVLAINLTGDQLRDHLDTRLNT